MATTPTFINRDPETIMAEVKSQMESLLGREIMPAQVEQLILQIICYREVLLLERFNAGMAQLLYQFSTAPILDYIASLVAVERLPAAFAGCIVRFTLVPGHANVVLPAGTRVATSDGQHIFEVDDDITIPSTVNMVETAVTAQVAGKGANGYAVGDVNVILDPYAWISSVANTTVTGGGSDIETDESLRERIKLAPTQYSTAGSRQSYIFHAKRANPSIIDVSVSSPIPGVVFIVPLCEDRVYEQVLIDIYNTCSAEDVRPLTDTVIVSEPQEVEYEIDVELTLFDGAPVQEVQNKVYQALNEFAESKSRRLGLDIVRSHISQVCRIAQVYDVNIISPTDNVVIDFNEIPVCTGITVNVTGFNHG